MSINRGHTESLAYGPDVMALLAKEGLAIEVVATVDLQLWQLV
jgi:hypothetical protein